MLLAALSTATPLRGAAADGTEVESEFEQHEWLLGDSRNQKHRTLIVSPARPDPKAKPPLLVLLHGLGETSDERSGARAWVDRYGLLTALGRLRHPPVRATTQRGDFTGERLTEVNELLRARPFGNLIIACPYTPNVWKAGNLDAALSDYARFVVETLLPEVRSRCSVATSATQTFIAGCSLGGFVGLEVFLRRPEQFGAFGGVQSALNPSSARNYAVRLEDAFGPSGAKPLLLLTSSADPFRAANVALARELEARRIERTLRVLPGPHDQPWLREAGALEMLLWHDRLAKAE